MQDFIQFFQLAHINVLDLIILSVFIFYGLEGLLVGFIGSSFDLLSFGLSFFIALRVYQPVGKLLVSQFALPQGVASAIGFFIVAFFSEVLLGFLFRRISSLVFRKLQTGDKESEPKIRWEYLRTVNHIFGIVPGILSAFVLLSFLLTLIIALPLAPALKNTVLGSRLGSLLVVNTQGFEKRLNNVFGGALNDTLSFMTIEPQSDQTVSLNFKTDKVTVDETAERAMLQLVNRERAQEGLEGLTMDNPLREVAQAHAKDMVARGYFSHFTPEGKSPFDRMAEADIHYSFAGENLAFAPSVDLAMQGLMQSPGHRANILSPNFKRVGIGVIDTGIYGEMFAQEFSD